MEVTLLKFEIKLPSKKRMTMAGLFVGHGLISFYLASCVANKADFMFLDFWQMAFSLVFGIFALIPFAVLMENICSEY